MKKRVTKSSSTKKKVFAIAGAGLICLLLILAASWYDIRYNDSRLVAPMNAGYVFTCKDLPMICSIILSCLYFLFLLVLIIKASVKNQKHVKETQTTRSISPKFGFMGFFGFLGFMGFWTYAQNKSIFPFMFFLFFGFFGFFYEGKLSNTFMDERFRENAMKAQLAALKISFSIIVIAFVLLGQGALMGNLEYNLIVGISVVFLSLALAIFLSEYLLYHYDHDDQCEG